jgi:hypothetical protein
VQTADDLEPLLEDMDAKVGISTQTLVSNQEQKGAKLPQYAAAVSGIVEKKNGIEITCLKT